MVKKKVVLAEAYVTQYLVDFYTTCGNSDDKNFVKRFNKALEKYKNKIMKLVYYAKEGGK